LLVTGGDELLQWHGIGAEEHHAAANDNRYQTENSEFKDFALA